MKMTPAKALALVACAWSSSAFAQEAKKLQLLKQNREYSLESCGKMAPTKR